MALHPLLQAVEKMREQDSWPWGFFGEDGKVYDKPPEHVRFRARRVPPRELKKLVKKANPRRVASRYAKITIPIRDLSRYLQTFENHAKTLKDLHAKLERINKHDGMRDWTNDSTNREFDSWRAGNSLEQLTRKMEYLGGLYEALDYQTPKKVIQYAEGSAEDMGDMAKRLEEEATHIRQNRAELEENREWYGPDGWDRTAPDALPRDLVEALYWLGGKEWPRIHKLIKEAPKRIKALLTIATPPETEDVETLYHASVDAKPLLRSGFNPQGKGGMGLGGSTDTDSGKPAISFTYDYYIAKEIARSLKEATLIAQGKVRPDTVLEWADKAGIKDKVIETARSTYFGRAVWDDPRKRIEHAMAYWYAYLAYAGRAGKRYNPVFWDNPSGLVKKLKSVNYRNIGVLVADVNMNDPDITYIPAEREYRVPVSAIVDLKKVIA